MAVKIRLRRVGAKNGADNGLGERDQQHNQNDERNRAEHVHHNRNNAIHRAVVEQSAARG